MLVFVPPLVTEGRRFEFVETIQFAMAALGLPALFVIGYPLDRLGRGRRGWGGGLRVRLEHLADGRRHHPGLPRALVPLIVDAGLVIAWRTPALMDALARHRWLVVVEVLSVAVVGVLLWLEIVASPPFSPRVPRPWRGVLAALIMWTIWIVSFVVGFSHVSWYVAFHHAGHGMSAGADQEISTGILWMAAFATYLPVVFGDTMAWLNNGDDPDAELRRLIRSERRSGAWFRPGPPKRWH